jgi:uncharacterized membrane protein YfcA
LFDLPLIADPWFYAISVPAVLLLGMSKSGFGSGFGSMVVPIMALVVPVPQAAAILMPVLLFTDVMGLAALRKEFDRKLVLFLLLFGLLGSVIGALSFKALAVHWVSGIVGAVTLLFLAQRLMFPPKADAAPPPRWLGALLTTVSGFTSFVAHAGAPPLNAYVIPLKLRPVVFAASMSVFFFFINLFKWVPYGWLGLLTPQNMATSLVFLPLVPLGVWVGVSMARRIQSDLFYKLVYAGMFLTGCKLLWDAVR